MKQPREQRYERYAFEASPWCQNLTQSEVADLLGTTKTRLEALLRDKEKFVRREAKVIGLKERNLALPVGKLRTVHERLKYHFNKIKQPDYLFSPRKGRGQRDNAGYHAGQAQFLKVDIKQFYPSTTSGHIFRWLHHDAGLLEDVAGLLVRLIAIDDKLPFGSPVSPVLSALVHRRMFDGIHALCQADGLRMSLWVDDLAISGPLIRGELLDGIRDVVRQNGLRSHKVSFRTGGRPVSITGVPIEGMRVVASRKLHESIQGGYAGMRACRTDADRMHCIDLLLSVLGTYRYQVGASTPEGRSASNKMHALRQRRRRLRPSTVTLPASKADRDVIMEHHDSQTDPPWDVSLSCPAADTVSDATPDNTCYRA